MNTDPLKQAIDFIRAEATSFREASTVFKNGEGIQWHSQEDKLKWADMIELRDQCQQLLDQLEKAKAGDLPPSFWPPQPLGKRETISIHILDTAADDDGWREWIGGPMPVDGTQCVEVKLRTGERAGGAARAFDWDRHQDKHPMEHIVAWRLVINRSHLFREA